MAVPSSLARDISPPPLLKRRKTSGTHTPNTLLRATELQAEPTIAAVEAGKAKVSDHLTYFKGHLTEASRTTPPGIPRLSIPSFASLYQSNLQSHGHHFVIHQHNHPVAGVHYDLRLQFSGTSSLSFAIPKGLPGDPNSKSISRLAIETRVHNYWNHLIESASTKTGSLLIWDMGTYSVLPRTRKKSRIPSPQTTDDETTETDLDTEEIRKVQASKDGEKNENEKLISAFQTHYIRLRLHGARLPSGYTVILRLPSNEVRKRPVARRKGRRKISQHDSVAPPTMSSDDDSVSSKKSDRIQKVMHDLDTDTEEDAQTRAYNAYPGSTNDIGSIHQRHWFLQLDRHSSGFLLENSGNTRGKWVGGFEPFIVRGRDHERSIVTGRLAREVESDEGVEGFVGRGGWTGIEY
ncbi:hypothetical protein P3342_011143 [Pyrenophora teres f. teres]|uniref:DNA ligase D 3'-phosphoesterase domain-containing protein n=1 Tax=Pyrenophora teres f. teres (strain 0-1) TaxID=861557 RepID=E3RHW7_PYRTT|nr:hypothetical protein PTT_07548 [Pyrenophora teres f. teres 0-1]KAE8824559.1 hypothetical protein PTNB85_09323 [Pyrenophora teres f. teres]KAE8835260.1 hypothetical protein HRS9122_07530 [Pyrenophora teres f. teres]KAK1909065.1 hypothetical protein P3342_011143 [Pyrenophora teres f. teres]